MDDVSSGGLLPSYSVRISTSRVYHVVINPRDAAVTSPPQHHLINSMLEANRGHNASAATTHPSSLVRAII